MIFINSKDIGLINNRISSLLKSRNIIDFDKFDFDSSQINNLIEQLEQPSLFDNNEVYILNITDSLKKQKDIDNLLEYLQTLSQLETETKIIFLIAIDEKPKAIDNLKIICNEIYSEQEITNKNKLTLIKELIKESKLNLSNEQMELLDNKLPKNINIIKSEISKLNNENLDNMDQIICDYNEFEIYNIINYYFKNDYKNLFKLIDKVFKERDGDSYLLNFLSSKTLNLYLIKKFLLNKWDYEDIAKELNLNKFAVMNDAKLVSLIKIEDIETLLYNLYNIEKISRTYYSDTKMLLKLLFLKVRITTDE